RPNHPSSFLGHNDREVYPFKRLTAVVKSLRTFRFDRAARLLFIFVALCAISPGFFPRTVIAESEEPASGMTRNIFESDVRKQQEAAEQQKLAEEQARAAAAEAERKKHSPSPAIAQLGSVLATANVKEQIQPPDERAKMRINPEAPAPFVGIADSYF